ncbi:hypothetical protein PR048_013156 [Dryococelus australis]|uniref:Secreted protein n=1 Tax=Dryococelus australis TaxID=614101 RepID=A0ABQ9HRU5_9NEOP|nr:hypothetical protein PR048_013156 [Dryococelus australis]
MLGLFVFTTRGPVMGRLWLVRGATSGPAMVLGACQLLANSLPAWHPTYEAAPGCKGKGNGRSPRKHANERHCSARLPHVKIREQPHRETNPVRLCGRRVVRPLHLQKKVPSDIFLGGAAGSPHFSFTTRTTNSIRSFPLQPYRLSFSFKPRQEKGHQVTGLSFFQIVFFTLSPFTRMGEKEYFQLFVMGCANSMLAGSSLTRNGGKSSHPTGPIKFGRTLLAQTIITEAVGCHQPMTTVTISYVDRRVDVNERFGHRSLRVRLEANNHHLG